MRMFKYQKKPNRLPRWLRTIHYPSYVIFFVTARCNASCKMCFYKDTTEISHLDRELTIEEYEKISKKIKLINILGISGGEPFLRDDLSGIVKIIYKNCLPQVVDLPTNGFFVESVLRQTKEIVRYCKDMIVDLQLSIDGPEKIHNEIRGLKDSFTKVRETYKGLVVLKTKYKNLRLKACVVYSHYNQDCMDELFDLLEKDFKDFDRIVFSVVHGSVSNQEAFNFDWDKYFKICDELRRTSVVKNIRDLHSLFTVALRIIKNEELKVILKRKDMYKKCLAGKRVIVVNQQGEVFPCEPLWYSMGNLRDNHYDLNRILNSSKMKAFNQLIIDKKCNCHWGLPISNALISTPQYYPGILTEMLKIVARTLWVRYSILEQN